MIAALTAITAALNGATVGHVATHAPVAHVVRLMAPNRRPTRASRRA
jgi:hypothetical protein